MVWKPRVTVAVVVEQEGRFLMVEEKVGGQTRFNQPAGHLEDSESLVQAAVRECLEETAWRFEPEALVGLYRWRTPVNGDTYLRASFTGRCLEQVEGYTLDPDISAVHWLTLDEIKDRRDALRSPLVMHTIEDYLQGRRYPLSLLKNVASEAEP